jgi:hypothetical protein
MLISIRSMRSNPPANRSMTAEETAGSVLAPLVTSTPRLRAESSSAPMPATKARPSARSM